jgi:predicted O-methyltransferase YrrM
VTPFLPPKLARRVAATVAHLRRRDPRRAGFSIRLDYPLSSTDEPRYGYGRPPHPRLTELLDRYADRYRAELALLERYERDLLAIGSSRTDDPLEPYWDQYWFFGLDAISLYGFIRSRAPSRYVEIGSGLSTLFAGRAIRDGKLDTSITSVDPEPRQAVNELCQHSVRRRLEEVDLAVFDELRAGDLVLMDGSHRVFTNSDATVFFLDVLPRLPPGVLVGVHDVFLPYDYPPEWVKSYYSEQYLLAAYLLAGGGFVGPVLPCTHVLADPKRYPSRLAANPHFAGRARPWNRQVLPGVAFWFETGVSQHGQ